ncbi:unnamed protein product [Enterobius vermicularis]|uniref:Tudor domain-containing protein n=1 Tax=Enterobius vermicularis TaxID=51028 RepID=A0A0N4VCA2_ENTVE|nr:unnamed protein product [Enterobius vermicularis]
MAYSFIIEKSLRGFWISDTCPYQKVHFARGLQVDEVVTVDLGLVCLPVKGRRECIYPGNSLKSALESYRNEAIWGREC